MLNVLNLVLAACVLGGLAAYVCADSPPASADSAAPATQPGDVLLFDGAHPLKEMPHVKIVDDPFATTQPGAPAPKVLKGGPLKNEPYQNKGTFVTDRHFVMPASGKAELVVVVAMKELTELKVEVWAKEPAGGMKSTTKLPAKTGWQTVIVPIDATKIKPGATVNDITLFQVGNNDAARFWIKGVWLRAK